MDIQRYHGRSLQGGVIYSFCTLVTNADVYSAMVASLVRLGFSPEDCEFLFIDNSIENHVDAFRGYNAFLRQAAGRYIVLCHQDIFGLTDDRACLDYRLAELEIADPTWGLCGNAGVNGEGQRFIRISDPFAPNQSTGAPFPRRVVSLDENFIVVRAEANLALSRDLSGFHWYGSDICLIADMLGWSAYVIDFHLRHDSAGNADAGYNTMRRQIRDKYARAYLPKLHRVLTERNVYLSGNRVVPMVINSALDFSIFAYALYKRYMLRRTPEMRQISRRIPGSQHLSD